MRVTTSLRLSKLRKNKQIREMLTETRISPSQFIMPLYIHEGLNEKKAIHTMPGQYQLSINNLEEEIASLNECGINSVILFGIPQEKDEHGRKSLANNAIVQRAIAKIKEIDTNMLVVADCCLCEYTSTGHCGVVKGDVLDHISTLEIIAEQAISLARAGADWIAPSGMIDHMVKGIREALDNAGYEDRAILSYSVKYTSSLYAPFREATEGAPKFGDRKHHQLNPANINEAMREAHLDVEEGADILMVKPAGFYLDVIAKVKQKYPEIPLAAYQVGGEYSLIKAAAKAGFVDEDETIYESLLAIKRAGADIIISMFAKDVMRVLKNYT